MFVGDRLGSCNEKLHAKYFEIAAHSSNAAAVKHLSYFGQGSRVMVVSTLSIGS